MTAGDDLDANWFSKPGDSLRSLMQRRGTSAEEIAGRLDVQIGVVRGLLDGSIAINTECAIALADNVGGTRDFWLNRQASYERRLDRAISAAINECDAWLDRVPLPESKTSSKLSNVAVQEKLRQRMIFFNVATIESWQERYGRLCADTRFRTSRSFNSQDAAVLIWLRSGEIEADLVLTQSWAPQKLKDRLEAIRRLSKIAQPSRFLPKLRALCAEAGVAVVVGKTPQGCYASGASRLISSDKAMMLLSFRHLADDQFWFTVFHEIGHLLLHDASTFVDGEGTIDDEREHDANDYARRCIVPEDRFLEFSRLTARREEVIRFSVSVGVSPGLIVGQMQHQGMIAHNRLNGLKRVWNWDDIASAMG